MVLEEVLEGGPGRPPGWSWKTSRVVLRDLPWSREILLDLPWRGPGGAGGQIGFQNMSVFLDLPWSVEILLDLPWRGSWRSWRTNWIPERVQLELLLGMCSSGRI